MLSLYHFIGLFVPLVKSVPWEAKNGKNKEKSHNRRCFHILVVAAKRQQRCSHILPFLAGAGKGKAKLCIRRERRTARTRQHIRFLLWNNKQQNKREGKRVLKPYLDTGKIVNTHGIKGEVKLEPWCDNAEMFQNITYLYLDSRGETTLKIEQARMQKNMVILKFKGIDTMNDAEKLKNKVVYANRQDIPMEEGEYFIQDLIGIQVLDADSGRLYGTLCNVSQTGANDVYHVRFSNGKEQLIPAIPQVVLEINPQEEKMLIHPLEGLFENDEI